MQRVGGLCRDSHIEYKIEKGMEFEHVNVCVFVCACMRVWMHACVRVFAVCIFEVLNFL